MRSLRFALCFLMLLLGGAQALAAPGDAIGEAVTVVNLVTARLEEVSRELAKGDDVRQQELIEVASDGRSELILRDNTKLALGPGSRLLLDKFIYDPDISGGAIVLDLVRGAFRFITGVAAKPAYVIRTPTASITVRGTIFDVYVQVSGVTWLLLIEDAIEVCSDGKCELHDEPGKLIRVTSGKVDKPVKWASLTDNGDVPFDSAFPFVVETPGFDPDPIFTREDIVLGTFPDKPGKAEEETEPSDNDGGRKAEEGNGRKKAKAHKKKTKEVKRRRRGKSDSANVGKIIKGLNITIGIGGGFGSGKKHRGDGPQGGGSNYNRFNK
ncbi:MAG TPA: FecR family protein [Hyphomicrobium sp.]